MKFRNKKKFRYGIPAYTGLISSTGNTYSNMKVIQGTHNNKKCICTPLKRSRVSPGSIVSDYGLDDRAIGVRSPAGAKDFSSSLCVQIGSEAHPASCTMGTGGPFPGGKARPGRDADHSPHLVPRS
jgi:hypothetical protein